MWPRTPDKSHVRHKHQDAADKWWEDGMNCCCWSIHQANSFYEKNLYHWHLCPLPHKKLLWGFSAAKLKLPSSCYLSNNSHSRSSPRIPASSCTRCSGTGWGRRTGRPSTPTTPAAPGTARPPRTGARTRRGGSGPGRGWWCPRTPPSSSSPGRGYLGAGRLFKLWQSNPKGKFIAKIFRTAYYSCLLMKTNNSKL